MQEKSLMYPQDEPNEPTKTPFICTPRVHICPNFNSRREAPLSSLAGVHCNGNSVYISFSGNGAASAPILTHLCVFERFIYSQDQSTYFLQQNRQTHRGNISFAHRHMNVKIGTEAPIFLFWEYLFKFFGILSLQCS